MATLFLSSEGEIIKNLLSVDIDVSYPEIFVFFAIWYFYTCTVYGTNVPAGLFLPGMILGCCLGTIVGKICNDKGWGLPEDPDEEAKNDAIKNYVVLGTAAVLAGYTRMTYSLAVIMMETANTFNLFIPVFFTILISNKVGSIFTRGLYDRGLRGKQIPVLKDSVPLPCRGIIAENLMAKNIVTVQRVDSLENISKVCTTSHHSFPVMNAAGKMIGMIPKNFIITLLQNRGYYIQDEVDGYQGKATQRAQRKQSVIQEKQQV